MRLWVTPVPMIGEAWDESYLNEVGKKGPQTKG